MTAKNKVTSSVQEGKTPPGTMPESWTRILGSWRLWAQSKDLSVGSIGLYGGKLRTFLRWLHEDFGWQGDIENLTVEHLRHFLVHLQNSGLAGQTRLSYRSALRSLWKFLRDDDLIEDDFFLSGRIPRPRLEEKVVPILDPNQLERLYKAAALDAAMAPRDLAMLALLEDSGLRISEACGLNAEDINWDNGLLLVRHGKGRKQRMVALGSTSMRYLDKYARNWRRKRMAGRQPWAEQHDSLFVGRSGEPWQPESVRGRLKVLAKRGGVDPAKVHPHVLRHGAATRLADAGMTEIELRALFGWARDSGMVERYTRSTTAARAIANHRRLSPLDQRRRS